MKLLFITQKIDEQDDDLAFTCQWVDALIDAGFDVSVICLFRGVFDDRFPVFSLGKEKGNGKVRQVFNFLKLVFTQRTDRVFVHMNPEYFTLAGWYWWIKGVPMFLWYTHYTTHIHLKLAAFYSRFMFAATPQSLPQYDGDTKKIITGHGVDIKYWTPEKIDPVSKYNIVMVHRLSRSKRIEIGILALLQLPVEYNITIYGRAVDEKYYKELLDLVQKNSLTERVKFMGPVPMPELRTIYPRFSFMINLASETIDKTMLEAMCSGLFPVTTTANLKAIGINEMLPEETSTGIADFVLRDVPSKYTATQLQKIVADQHSLAALVQKLKQYIDYNYFLNSSAVITSVISRYEKKL